MKVTHEYYGYYSIANINQYELLKRLDDINIPYKYSEYDLIEFLKAIEVTLFDLKKEVADTIDELNRHEKIIPLK